MSRDYYVRALSGERLRRCYELAPPRVARYLEAEIEFVLDRLRPSHIVLELGCGYGRVLERLARRAGTTVGIDTSRDSLRLARSRMGRSHTPHLVQMNAIELGFPDRLFDHVVCIQNGISAFHVDPGRLIVEAMRVTRRGGTVLVSSYSPRFWEPRLEWFKIQAAHGLIGEIDLRATGDGVIVCADGFRATTLGREDFMTLLSGHDVTATVTEVDGSSLFCEIRPR